MIQIPSDTPTAPQTTSASSKDTLPASPYILRRIFYTLILGTVLLLTCFYLDLLEDYDLLSMVLGFLVCTILQFTVLSYYFEEEMNTLQMDEFGVIKDKIKTAFGELNHVQQQQKVREKYYRRQVNEDDRLFSESNDRIYQKVMTYLRGKEVPNFTEQISKVKGKWLSLDYKVQIIEDFLKGMLRLEDGKKMVYQRHKNRLKRIVQTQQHKDWAYFLAQKPQDSLFNFETALHNTTYYSQTEQLTTTLLGEAKSGDGQSAADASIEESLNSNWGILNAYMLQKTKLVQKEAVDLKERVIQQFQSYAATIRSSNLAYTKKREKLYEDYKASEQEKNKNILQLQKNANKIIQLSNSLPGNQIEGGQIQLILKKQFELRLLKIESQNLLIRLSKTHSDSLANAQLLFVELEEQNRDLQHYLVIFNRKINQYLHQMAGFGQKRAPSLQKYIQQASLKPLPHVFLPTSTDPDELYSKVMSRRSKEGAFRGHLDQLVRQFQELKDEHSKARIAIKDFKIDMERKQSMEGLRGAESRVGVTPGARVLYFASTVQDERLTNIFEQLTSIEERYSQKMKHILNKQLSLVRQFEKDYGAQFSSDLKHSYEEYKRRQQECRKLKKRPLTKQDIEYSNDVAVAEFTACRVRLVQLMANYLFNSKISNTLSEIMGVMSKHEEDYVKLASQIDTEEAFDLQNQKTNDVIERKKQKYAAFTHCLANQTEDIIDERLPTLDHRVLLDKVVDEVKVRSLIDIWKGNANKDPFLQRVSREGRQGKLNQFFKYEQSPAKSLDMINRILSILFNEWSRSEFFHTMIRDELLISLNRKKPDIVEHLRIDFFRIVEKDKDRMPITNLRVLPSQIYRCLFDFHLDFKGKILVKIGSRLKIGNKPQLQVRLQIKQFACPLRVCFTPFSIGKGYASLLDKPKLVIDYSVKVGGFELTKIPLFTQFIKTYAVIKLRKKFMWPKRMTLSLPVTVKSPLELAIQQRHNFEKERERLNKKNK